MIRLELFGQTVNALGESPLWDPRCGWLWWVDIHRRMLMAADATGAIMFQHEYLLPLCSIGLAQTGLVAALADGFALIAPDGTITRLARPAIGAGAIRFNDGKMDRQGRFLSGTMQYGDQDDRLATVWRLVAGRARQVASGLRLINSICFSPEGDRLYFSDTLDAVIWRFAYDTATGEMGPREVFFDCTAIGAHPDGATVDAQGRLWVALVTSGEIACISRDGVLLDRIALPVPYPSCPAFGGPEMDVLFATTISNSGHRLRSDDPQAGRMLAIRGLGVCGIPEAIYASDNHI